MYFLPTVYLTVYNIQCRHSYLGFFLQGESFQSTVPTSSMERSPNPVAVTAFAETILLFKIWKTKLFAVLCVCKIEKMHCGSLTVYYRDYPRIILSYISAGCSNFLLWLAEDMDMQIICHLRINLWFRDLW